MRERIVFLGTPEISAYLLEDMIKKGFNIVGVVSKEDKQGKRGNKLVPSSVSEVAMKYNIPLHRPVKLNKDYEFVEKLEPDLLLTFAYGQILSSKVLALGKYRPLNVHASLLPKYRGSNPIQYALRNGDKVTGITLMEMVKECDAGNYFAQVEIPIDDKDNLTSMEDKIKVYACELIEKYLPLYFENKLEEKVQDPTQVTFTKMLTKEEEHLSLDLGCVDFVNFVRSLAYDIGGYLDFNGENLKIFAATVVNDKVEAEVGKIILAKKKNIILQLKDGQVNIDLLQRPGKKMMATCDFNNGNRDLEGAILK